MREIPILFTGPMVEATMDDLKTVTRRTNKLEAINQNSNEWTFANQMRDGRFCFDSATKREIIKSPYGQAGDALWVRETWATHKHQDATAPRNLIKDRVLPPVVFQASVTNEHWFDRGKWRPGIFLPRAFARTFLEVISVTVERLHDITEAEAIAEGIIPQMPPETWWQGYRDLHETGDETGWIHQQATGETPPEWMLEPKRMARITALDHPPARDRFRTLWDGINRARGYGWDKNPWVWRVEFKRLEVNP